MMYPSTCGIAMSSILLVRDYVHSDVFDQLVKLLVFFDRNASSSNSIFEPNIIAYSPQDDKTVTKSKEKEPYSINGRYENVGITVAYRMTF